MAAVTLCLDTSSAVAVALVEREGDGAPGAVLARASELAPRFHAELLAGLVRGVLREAGVTAAEVAEVVVGTGPAPFTGLRVGLVTARTLAHAWAVPLAGVCSLDALGAAHGGDCTVVADARRREVYWAQYRGGERAGEPAVAAPSDVPVAGDAVGRGALLYPEVFASAAATAAEGALVDPDPAVLAQVAARLRAAGQRELPTEPLYLRRPDVHGKT